MSFKLYRRGEVYWLSGTVDGKRYRETTGSTDRTLAQDFAAKREWELRRAAVHGAETVLTFGAAIDIYVKAGKPGRHLGPLFDLWEHTPLKDLKPGVIKEAARKLYPKAKASTRNRQVLTPAKAVINHAAELGHCGYIRISRFAESKTIRRAVDRRYIDAIRKYASPELGAIALFMFQTAARVSEAVSLEWDDVDLTLGAAVFQRTKNGDPHVAYLTTEMVAILANLPKDRRRVFGFGGKSSIYPPLRKACKAAGVPYLGTHQPGRHSFATEMIVRQGFDPKTTAERGNWKSVRLLLDNYTHAENGRDIIEKAFGTPSAHKKTK